MVMKMPKVSIIVPVYNVEKYIKKCIESLINQTLKDIEIIFVDDGSTDNSRNVIESYNDDRIRYIYQENGKQGKARNNGIRHANGEYLAFIDDDDYVDLDMYEKMYNTAIKEDADMVLCDLEFIKDGKTNYLDCMERFCDDDIKNYIMSNNGPTNKIIKREIILNNDLYFLEGHVYEDFAIQPIYGLYVNKIVYMKFAPYKYIIRSGSTMNQLSYNEKLRDIFYSYDYLMEQYRKTEMKYDEEFEFVFIANVFHAASFRFLPFKEGKKDLLEINKMLRKDFPNWRKNKYYKMKSFKYKVLCNLLYYKQYKLLNLMKKVKNKLK